MVVSPTVPTTYTITGKNANQCLSDTTLLIRAIDCNLVGLANRVQTENAVFIYPNPIRNKFTVETSNLIIEIEIVDVLGKRAFHEPAVNTNKAEIDCSNWLRGIYFIKIRNSTGKQAVKKIIIE